MIAKHGSYNHMCTPESRLLLVYSLRIGIKISQLCSNPTFTEYMLLFGNYNFVAIAVLRSFPQDPFRLSVRRICGGYSPSSSRSVRNDPRNTELPSQSAVTEDRRLGCLAASICTGNA